MYAMRTGRVDSPLERRVGWGSSICYRLSLYGVNTVPLPSLQFHRASRKHTQLCLTIKWLDFSSYFLRQFVYLCNCG